MGRAQQVQELLSDSGFGFMVFCSVIHGLESFFPIIDLELDCRGSLENIISFEDYMPKEHVIACVGEIKSSYSGVSKAKDQLLKRLLVLQKSIAIKYTRDDLEVILEGIVFFQQKQK